MISLDVRKKYIPTIGIECHVQLKTKTKLFSSVGNDAREAPPNTLISPLCFGMPGTLPVLNEQAIKLAIRAGLALNAEVAHFSKFDRKHYFYPDLPKGYQITQFDQPTVKMGQVTAVLPDGTPFVVRITRAHLEEDAGKSTHPAGKDYSLVDLNRAGTPLLEIVSEPDMHTAAEAKAYAHELWLLMRYADVSDADLYYGNMRFDVNVSVSTDPAVLGTRSETKNLNSFRSVEKAVEYEVDRQIELLEKGQAIVQETRGWDDAKQKTFSQRTKEDAHDYRYFPDPDLPPVVIEESEIEAARQVMPVMPGELRAKLTALKLDRSSTETLIEAIPAGRFMLQVLENTDDKSAARIANWLAGDVQAAVTAGEFDWDKAQLDLNSMLELSQMVSDNKLSSTSAKQVLQKLLTKGGSPVAIADELDLLQVSDSGELEKIVAQVLADNPKAATDVQNGEMKAIGFLVGQVMKASQGKANPPMVQELIKKQLSQ